MALRKHFALVLIISLFFSLFLGGYHHGCDYYSQAYSTCHQTGHQPMLLAAADAADYAHPLPVTSYLVLPTEIFPNPSTVHTPLHGRAPPRSS